MYHDSVTSSAEQLSCTSFSSLSPRKKGLRSTFKSNSGEQEHRPNDVTMVTGYEGVEADSSFASQLGDVSAVMDSSFMTADEGMSSPPSSQQQQVQSNINGNARSTRASSKRQKQQTTPLPTAAKSCLDEAAINALLYLQSPRSTQQPHNVQFVQ
jgi:hypothetical protein